MVEYKVNTWRVKSSYDEKTDTILLGGGDFSMLSDSEEIEFVTDIIIHEYMHKVLYEMFDLTLTKLFDAIQQHFRDVSLHERILAQHIFQETYQSYIKNNGFKAFLEYYHIDNDNFNQSFILCNSR